MTVTSEVVVEQFRGDQTAMNEVAAFHLMVRQWQIDNGQNAFSDIYSSQDDLTKINEYYLSGKGNFFVASAADTEELVGIVGLRDEGGGHGVVKRMAVDPKYHGRGIGRRLMNSLIDYARVSDFSALSLETSSMERAKELVYDRVGFVVVSIAESSYDYMMRLDLS